MKKSAKSKKNQAEIVNIFSGLEPEEIQLLMRERAKTAALNMGIMLLEQEVEELCGAMFSRKGDSHYHRGGSEQSSIIAGGGKYQITRPRVRGGGKEVQLKTLLKLRNQDLLDAEMEKNMLLGVSSRNYEKVVEGYSERLGTSKSSVSRAFQRASKKDLDEINEGDLSSYSFCALMLDGVEIAERCIVCAVGITEELEKVVVGLVDGDTENSTVVRDLLSSLLERNFTTGTEKLLCVLDGSKALKKAVRSVFGECALIQRCWLHKMRNIQGYIPKEHYAKLHWRMKKLMNLKSFTDAQKEYRSLRSWLKGIADSAATSLDEAGEELLTIHKLGITGELRKSLSTTNIIESLFSVARRKTANVKNWVNANDNQRLRWIASALTQHKTSMRKLRGVKQKNILLSALGKTLEQQKISA